MTRLRAIVSLMLLIAPAAGAQPNSGAAFAPSVAGYVFDSTSNAPLVGAVVQVASSNPSIVPRSDTTDAAGHFRIDGLTNGRYVIGFEHETLGALGLESPLRSLDIKMDTEYAINLAIPSGRVVRQLKCGGDTSGASGVLIGFVGAADNQAASPRATISASWQAIVLDKGNLRTETQRAADVSAPDGSYAVCGLPLGAVLDVEVRAAGHRAVAGTVVVPDGEVALNNFLLANSSSVRGPGAVTGFVTDDAGKRVATGRATIDALSVDAPITNGGFAFRDLPIGTWKIDVRAIGYEPRSTFVDVRDSVATTRAFVVGKRVPELETVTVMGSKSRETTILEDVLRRKAASAGTMFLPGNPHLQAAWRPSDVLRAARGFKMPYSDAGCNRKNMSVFLNGEPWPLGFESLDRIIEMRDVLAIEVYSSKMRTPIQWQQDSSRLNPMRGCATAVVWTRNR